MPLEAISAGDRVLVRGYAAKPEAGTNPFAASSWYDADTGVASRLPTDPTVTSATAAGYFFSAWTGQAVWALNYLGHLAPDDVATAERVRPGRERVAEHSRPRRSRAEASRRHSGRVRQCSSAPNALPAQSPAVGGLEFVPGS